MKRTFSLIVLMAVMCSCLAMTAHAADYSFTTAASVDYYDYTSYEDAYGSQYNYGGSNVVDYQFQSWNMGRSARRRPVSWKISSARLAGIRFDYAQRRLWRKR